MTTAERLDELALRHGTDKSSARHDFARIYEQLLAHRRDEALTILEIGVYEGASLRMWRDYFPNARIFGLDVKEEAAAHGDERTTVLIGDQADTAVLDRVVAATGPLDLVVDDGGHRARQQKRSLRHLWAHLRPGGVYAIEDIHTSYLARWGMGYRSPNSTVEFLKDVVDDIHAKVHGEPPRLGDDIASMHVHFELCVLVKRETAALQSSSA